MSDGALCGVGAGYGALGCDGALLVVDNPRLLGYLSRLLLVGVHRDLAAMISRICSIVAP